MVHSFHEALRATFHELSENYNPRGSIVYVLTRQRSIVIILIVVVGWTAKISIRNFIWCISPDTLWNIFSLDNRNL